MVGSHQDPHQACQGCTKTTHVVVVVVVVGGEGIELCLMIWPEMMSKA